MSDHAHDPYDDAHPSDGDDITLAKVLSAFLIGCMLLGLGVIVVGLVWVLVTVLSWVLP